MANFNRVIMMGNLTRDPEFKQLSSGQSVCRLGLASNRQFKNRQTDTMVQEVCFIDVDVWGAQAESCRQYLQKGRAVLVEGRLKFDSWQDNNGQNRSKHLIVADRVLFLSATDRAETSEAEVVGYRKKESAQAKSTVDAKLEKELLDQIEAIKKRSISAEATVDKSTSEVKPAKKVATKEDKNEQDIVSEEPQVSSTGSGNSFKDEPPFQDDLPF